MISKATGACKTLSLSQNSARRKNKRSKINEEGKKRGVYRAAVGDKEGSVEKHGGMTFLNGTGNMALWLFLARPQFPHLKMGQLHLDRIQDATILCHLSWHYTGLGMCLGLFSK